MPIIKNSSFPAQTLLSNGHLQTIYPFFFRKVKNLKYHRNRIDTPDQDFLDLDYAPVPNTDSLVILTHGLEGRSDTQYMMGMAREFNSHGVDALAWNMRSCSNELNRKPYFYHGGMTEDLEQVFQFANQIRKYKSIYFVGFSLGAAMTLKYLGERGSQIDPRIKGACVFSAPCCLKSSGDELSRPIHKFYAETFLSTMRKKVLTKMETIDLGIDPLAVKAAKNFTEFDEVVSAPLFGFRDALHFYEEVSAKNYLNSIEIPTLVVNAKNDPFLGKECYPIRAAKTNPNLYLEIPESGGHVGFVTFDDQSIWSEKRASEFLLKKNSKAA